MFLLMCVYVYFFVLICIHACVSLYLVCAYMYVCPCLHILVRVLMSIACMHAYGFVYLCVCLGRGGQTESTSLLISLPSFRLLQSSERTNASLNWRNQCIPECSHPLTSSAQHSLPSVRRKASGLLPDGAVHKQF